MREGAAGAAFLDREALAAHALGVTAALDEDGGWFPDAVVTISEILHLPENGWVRAARVSGPPWASGRVRVRLALVCAQAHPGAPVWLWRAADEDEDPELVFETSEAQLGEHGGAVAVLVGRVAAEAARLLDAGTAAAGGRG